MVGQIFTIVKRQVGPPCYLHMYLEIIHTSVAMGSKTRNREIEVGAINM